METKRTIVFFKGYFLDFFYRQPENVREKIDFVLFVVSVSDRIPRHLFKHIREGMYEIRIQCESNIFRIFCCFDKGNIVVLFNGFQKKKQKTPDKEIHRGLKIMKEYFDTK